MFNEATIIRLLGHSLNTTDICLKGVESLVRIAKRQNKINNCFSLGLVFTAVTMYMLLKNDEEQNAKIAKLQREIEELKEAKEE